MMSLRAIARSAPRTLAVRSMAAAAFRTVAAPAIRTTSLKATASFSTSALRRRSNNPSLTNEELSSKLASEIEFEKEVEENEPLPASIQDFLDNSPFELQDTLGKEDVILTRTFGNEKITVSFSIADLQNYNEDMFEEDMALGDEDVEDPSSAIANKQQQQQRGEEEDEDVGESSSEDQSVPVRLNVVVEKPGKKGSLNIEAVAENGAIVIENVFYYDDAKMAHSTDAQAVHAAQDVYPGPHFSSLDEDLQILLERYLEDRGITQALAIFAPDYIDYKEQKEYMAWLQNVKAFVDA